MRNKEDKIGNRVPLLVITGQYQNGKSTFLNCLLGGNYAVEGKGLVTTKYNAKYTFGDCRMMHVLPVEPGKKGAGYPSSAFFSPNASLEEYEKDSLLEVYAYSPMLESLDLLDSPGCGANGDDDSVAESAIAMADFVIFIVQKEISSTELSFIKKISAAGKHFSVILNCMNDLAPDSPQAQNILQSVHSKLRNAGVLDNYVTLSEEYPVYPVNLLWAQCALGYLDDAVQEQKMHKVRNYLDDDDVSPIDLLAYSNFMAVRGMIRNAVNTFFDYTPYNEIKLLKATADSWTSELVKILEGNNA